MQQQILREHIPLSLFTNQNNVSKADDLVLDIPMFCIIDGVPYSINRSPVSKAICHNLRARYSETGLRKLRWLRGEFAFECPTPTPLADWMILFDIGDKVEPMSFVLTGVIKAKC